MSEQNPWKKQLQAQKVKNTETINNQNPSNTNTPPWVKKSPNAESQSPIAPWMKKTQSPPWMKKQQSPQQNINQSPPWMKKQDSPQQNSTQSPPWMKKKQESPQNNTQSPPWMNKKNENFDQNNSSPQSWMKNNSFNNNSEKQRQEERKRDEQQKIIKIKIEEENREENERIRMKIEEQLSNERQKQDELQLRLNKQRKQRQEAQQKEKILSAESEKNKQSKKKQGKKTKKTNKKIQMKLEKQESKLYLLSKDEEKANESTYEKYLNQIENILSKQEYRSKMYYQRGLILFQKQFLSKCQQQIQAYLTKMKKISNRKKNKIFLEDIHITYALCEGKKVGSSPKSQESKDFINFDNTEMIKLRQIFLKYQMLQNHIFKILKKHPYIKMRAPLMCYVAFKGLQFLCESVCDQLVSVIASDNSFFNQISAEMMLLEKQMKQKQIHLQKKSSSRLNEDQDTDLNGEIRLSKDELLVKKIRLGDEEYYVLYIKQENEQVVWKQSEKKKQKPHTKQSKKQLKNQSPHEQSSSESSSSRLNNVLFNSSINKLTDIKFLQLLYKNQYMFPLILQNSVHSPAKWDKLPLTKWDKLPLTKWDKLPLTKWDKLPLTKPKQNILNSIALANAIYTVYCSCQSEVNEESFFRLILEGNKEIWSMINMASGHLHSQEGIQKGIVPGIQKGIVPGIQKGIVLAYLERISSINFNYYQVKPNKKIPKNVCIVRCTKPKGKVYQYEDLQIIQFYNNFDKYILEDKMSLSEEALMVGREVFGPTHKEDNQNQQKYNSEEKVLSKKESKIHMVQLQNEINYLLADPNNHHKALQFLESQYRKYVLLYNGQTLFIENVEFSLLFIKIFTSLDEEIQILKKLSEFLNLLEYFYHNQENRIHYEVYSCIGMYYAKKYQQIEKKYQKEQKGIESQKNEEKDLEKESQKSIIDDMLPQKDQAEQNVIKFYSYALDIALRLYGQKSIELADIYLSRAEAFSFLQKYDFFYKDIDQAMKIYKGISKNTKKIADCSYILGKTKCLSSKSETQKQAGVQLLESSSSMYLKIGYHFQAMKIQFQLYEMNILNNQKQENLIENILVLSLSQKSIKNVKKIIKLMIDRQIVSYSEINLQNLRQKMEQFSLNENDEELDEDKSQEQMLIQLQNSLVGFARYIDILKWTLSIISVSFFRKNQHSGEEERAITAFRKFISFYPPNEVIFERIESNTEVKSEKGEQMKEQTQNRQEIDE